VEKSFTVKNETFWRNRVLPEEDHVHLGTEWKGGYRWFRSENIVCLEHYRRVETKPTPESKAS
jgi:hypothetical protein